MNLPSLSARYSNIAPRFEQRDRLAAICRRLIDHGRDAVVGGDFQEVGLELLSLSDIDRDDPVGEAGFLQEHGDLVPVGRRPVVEIDHHGSPFMRCTQI